MSRFFYEVRKMATEIKVYRINETEIWQGKLHKVNGEDVEKAVRFILRPLNPADAEAMGKLSENIYRHLRKGEECFIHKHSGEYFYNVFDNPHLHYTGIFVGNTLIGMSYLKICENFQELQEELPNAEYDFFRAERNGGKSRVASFGADSVLPEYRGNALNSVMVNYRLKLAEQMGCTDCTSIVDRKNKWNMAPYFSGRFNLFATAVDPSDGGKISLLHRPLGKETVLSCFKPRIMLPFDRFELIDGLIGRGFVGIDFNRETGGVLFAHSSYYTNKGRTIDGIQLLHQRKMVGMSL